jgi:hypothetical protein
LGVICSVSNSTRVDDRTSIGTEESNQQPAAQTMLRATYACPEKFPKNAAHLPAASIVCRPTPRPNAPITLYRGADYPGRHGMSWTPLLWGAHGAAWDKERTNSPVTAVYTCDAPPEALLCRMFSYGTTVKTARQRVVWDEYVVDPAYLNDDSVREVFRLYRDGVPVAAQAVGSWYARFQDNLRVGG